MLSNAPINAALPASDLARAKKFYQETLGLTVKSEDNKGIVFECGNSTHVLVYPSEFAGTNKATAAGWSVDDVEAEMTDLKSKGVVFEEYDMPGLKTEGGLLNIDGEKAAWFKDSEGNILAIASGM